MVFEENFLRLTVAVRFQKMKFQKHEFSYHFFHSVITPWLSQNKFTFHPHLENHRFTSLIILQV